MVFGPFGSENGIHFAHFGLQSGMVCEGTTRVMNVFMVSMDLFTDTAAILNQFDLRSIIGSPGGMSTIRFFA